MGKYLGAAALEEFTRHAFLAGAQIERSFTRMGIGLGIPREKVQELREEIEKLSVKTGISAKDLRDGFNLMVRDTRLSLHEVEHIFPRIADGAKVAGVTSSQMAEVIAAALRNFKPAGDIEKVIDDLVSAPRATPELGKHFPNSPPSRARWATPAKMASSDRCHSDDHETQLAAPAPHLLRRKFWKDVVAELAKNSQMPGGYANLRQELERVQKSGGDGSAHRHPADDRHSHR
jgi:hypothetical protein